MLYKIIQFLRDINLEGEELDWELTGVSRDIFGVFKEGDRIAVKKHDDCEGEPHTHLFTYNSNYDEDLAASDSFSPFIVFYQVPRDCFKDVKIGLSVEECHELETQNYNNYLYRRPHHAKQ